MTLFPFSVEDYGKFDVFVKAEGATTAILIPECCTKYRCEALKALAKRAVRAILGRQYIYRYVEEQKREIPPRRAAGIFKSP